MMTGAGSNRVRRSAGDWREILERQQASGLSQAAFCQREGIALSTFARWKQRFDADARTDSEPVAGESGWVELPAVGLSTSAWMIELDLGGGVCLRLKPA